MQSLESTKKGVPDVYTPISWNITLEGPLFVTFTTIQRVLPTLCSPKSRVAGLNTNCDCARAANGARKTNARTARITRDMEQIELAYHPMSRRFPERAHLGLCRDFKRS